jgi:aspartyl-tRNA(Asn)/glutamyl-tRNA(Gln) amidotransferase subunit B
MRSKEVANDYRYFPEPDLLPIVIDSDYIEAVRATLPELPGAKRTRFTSDYGLSEYDAALIVPHHAMADYFEAVVQFCKAPKPAANWILGDLSGALNRNEMGIEESPITPERLAGLIVRIEDGTLSSKLAKQVFDAMWEGEGDTDEIVATRGLKQVSDSGALEAMVDEVIANSPGPGNPISCSGRGQKKKTQRFFCRSGHEGFQGSGQPADAERATARKAEQSILNPSL